MSILSFQDTQCALDRLSIVAEQSGGSLRQVDIHQLLYSATVPGNATNAVSLTKIPPAGHLRAADEEPMGSILSAEVLAFNTMCLVILHPGVHFRFVVDSG